MKIDWNKEKENLFRLINDGIPYTKIGEMYGVTGNAIKKTATKLGIVLTKRRKTNPNETFNRGKHTINNECKCLYCGKTFSTKGRKKYYNKKGV